MTVCFPLASMTSILFLLVPTCLPLRAAEEKDLLHLTLRSRVKGAGDQFTAVETKAAWDPKKTALVICDMWDDHWCRSAARRSRGNGRAA